MEKPDNQKAREALGKWLNSYWFPYLVNEEYGQEGEPLFLPIKRVIFVIDKWRIYSRPSTEGIVIPVPGSIKNPWINVVAVKQWEGCYIGRCRIEKIMDWDVTGDFCVYITTPN